MCGWRQAIAAPFTKTLNNPKSGLGDTHIGHFFALNGGVILPPRGGGVSKLLT